MLSYISLTKFYSKKKKKKALQIYIISKKKCNIYFCHTSFEPQLHVGSLQSIYIYFDQFGQLQSTLVYSVYFE